MSEPGWYVDPYDDRMLRWWDGATWTEHAQPAAPEQVESPQPQSGFGQYDDHGAGSAWGPGSSQGVTPSGYDRDGYGRFDGRGDGAQGFPAAGFSGEQRAGSGQSGSAASWGGGAAPWAAGGNAASGGYPAYAGPAEEPSSPLDRVKELFSGRRGIAAGVVAVLVVGSLAAVFTGGEKEPTPVSPSGTDVPVDASMPFTDDGEDFDGAPDPAPVAAFPEIAPDAAARPVGAMSGWGLSADVNEFLRARLSVPVAAPPVPAGASLQGVDLEVSEGFDPGTFTVKWGYDFVLPGSAAVEGESVLTSAVAAGLIRGAGSPAELVVLGIPDPVQGTRYAFEPNTPGGVSWEVGLFELGDGMLLITVDSLEAQFTLSDPSRVSPATLWAANVPLPAGARLTGVTVRATGDGSPQGYSNGLGGVYFEVPAEQYDAIRSAAVAGSLPMPGQVQIVTDSDSYLFGNVTPTDPAYAVPSMPPSVTFNIYPPRDGVFAMDYSLVSLGAA